MTLDAKGRFLFPAGLKKQMKLVEGESVRFTMKRGIEPCITLIPEQNWLSTLEKLKRLNDFTPDVREFKRKYLSGIIEVEMDNAGRIQVPKNLMAYAGLTRDLALNSLGKELELWDREKYQERYTTYSSEDFSALANRVMGEGNL